MDVGISGMISIGFSTVYPFYAEWEYDADRMARFWIQLQAASAPIIELSEDTKKVLFQMLKSKKSGNDEVIDLRELGECLRTLGFSPSHEDVEFLKKHFDDNQDGELTITELMDNLDVLNYHFYYGRALMNAFRSIDRDGDGVIRFPEMLHVLMSNRTNPLSHADARTLLTRLAHEFDENFDGKFSYAEFVKIYMSDVLPFKQELSSGTMIDRDVPFVKFDDDHKDEEKDAIAEDLNPTAKKRWSMVKEKVRTNTMEAGGSSKKASLHPDAVGKPRRRSRTEGNSEGVLLYARGLRRQSWAP